MFVPPSDSLPLSLSHLAFFPSLAVSFRLPVFTPPPALCHCAKKGTVRLWYDPSERQHLPRLCQQIMYVSVRTHTHTVVSRGSASFNQQIYFISLYFFSSSELCTSRALLFVFLHSFAFIEIHRKKNKPWTVWMHQLPNQGRDKQGGELLISQQCGENPRLWILR